MKILITENQLERIIDSYINEVDNPSTKTIEYNITSSFNSGEYKITDTKDIDNALNSFMSHIRNGVGTYTIEIISSESKVPNRGVGLNSGDLSKFRGENVKKYIESKNIPNVQIKVTDLGPKGPNWDPKKGSKDPTYLEHQRVSLKLYGSIIEKPEESVNVECLFNLQISIDYRKEVKADGKTIEHKCDDAIFMLTANGIPIINTERNDYFIDLNNKNDGGNRYSNLIIRPDDAKKILNNKKDIDLIVYCMSNKDPKGCHSDPLLIGIKNGKNETIMEPKYIALGEGLKYKAGKRIMRLDSCGKVLNVSLAKGDDVKNTDLEYDQKIDKNTTPFEVDENNISSIAEIYKYLNTQRGTLEFSPKSTQGYMRNMARLFNHRPWTWVKQYLNLDDKKQSELDRYMMGQKGKELYTKVQQERESGSSPQSLVSK